MKEPLHISTKVFVTIIALFGLFNFSPDYLFAAPVADDSGRAADASVTRTNTQIRDQVQQVTQGFTNNVLESTGGTVGASAAGRGAFPGAGTGAASGPGVINAEDRSGDLPINCSINPIYFSLRDCVLYGAYQVSYYTEYIIGLIAVVASTVLDFTIKFAILDLHKYLETGGPLVQIWVIVRDFCNLFFIILLLYVGFGTIVGSNLINPGDWKKRVPAILLAALLINFSLPLTRAGVDVSNIVALQFYKALKPEEQNKFDAPKLDDGWLSSFRIDRTIAWPMFNVLSETKARNVGKTGDALGKMMTILLSSIYNIFVLLALTFVLIFGAALVGYRSLTLLFLIPLSAAPWILELNPGTEKRAQDYWKRYWAALASLPAYMFFLYLSLFVALQVGGALNATGVSGFVQSIVAGMIGIGFMALSVAAALDVGEGSADGAMDLAKRFTGAGLGGIGKAASYIPGAGLAARAAANIDKRSGGRIGNTLKTINAEVMGGANSSFGFVAGKDFKGLAPSAEERTKEQAESGKATRDLLQARIDERERPKKELQQKVDTLHLEARAKGVDKDPAQLSKFMGKMSAEEQKEFYKKLESPVKAKLEGKDDRGNDFLSQPLKENIGGERMVVLRGKPQEQSVLLKSMKPEARYEAYKALDNASKIAVERIMKARSLGTDPEAATYKSTLDEIEGYDYETRKAVVAISLEGDTGGQIDQLEELKNNPVDQEEFFRSIKTEDRAALLYQLEASGTGTPRHNLAQRLKNSLGSGGKESLEKGVQGLQYLSILNTSTNSDEIKRALQAMPTELLKKHAPKLFTDAQRRLYIHPEITKATLQRLNDIDPLKKAAIKAELERPGAGVDLTVLNFLRANDKWDV